MASHADDALRRAKAKLEAEKAQNPAMRMLGNHSSFHSKESIVY